MSVSFLSLPKGSILWSSLKLGRVSDPLTLAQCGIATPPRHALVPSFNRTPWSSGCPCPVSQGSMWWTDTGVFLAHPQFGACLRAVQGMKHPCSSLSCSRIDDPQTDAQYLSIQHIETWPDDHASHADTPAVPIFSAVSLHWPLRLLAEPLTSFLPLMIPAKGGKIDEKSLA